MLSKEQLQTIADALENHPEATDDLKRIIQAELDYQTATAPLWADRDKLLAKANRTEAEEKQLDALSKPLSELSDRRPAEFGGMFHPECVEAHNIIRRAAEILDGYVPIKRELVRDAASLLKWLRRANYPNARKVAIDSVIQGFDTILLQGEGSIDE